MPRREDARRVALLYGPYATPDVRVGQSVADPRFPGAQEVLRLHDCPLGVWPVLRRKGTPVWLGGDLLRAARLESNAAVAYWWGAHPDLVTRWRKALGVAETNEGTRSLRHDRTPTQIHREDSRQRSEAARRTERHRRLRSEAALAQAHGPEGSPGAIDPGRLRACLIAAGMTQAELARRAGLSPMRVSQLARGKQSGVTRETLTNVASVLSVAPGNLLA